MGQNIMDLYYRAAKKFAAELSGKDEGRKLRELIARNGLDTEKLSSVYFDVKIDDTWIERIEMAIPHLEAAIREDRQFIKSEGNINPIERVRKVSRSSVEHLARHSEMITHVPEEGDDLIPDKLKVYENESNFAVYENRVLYMVLCYTRDFLDYRYFRIAKAYKESESQMEFQKSVRTEGGRISFAAKLTDGTNGLLDSDDQNARKIARIEAAAGEISVLLSMSLMKEVALAPMVTPPITRTNVLRMDNHFKEVVALYDFLSEYSGDGFSLERHENSASPFPEGMENEITELMMFSMFLNGKYGRSLSKELEERYQAEEERRLAEERKKREEYFRALLEEVRANGGTEKDYLKLIKEERSRREELETKYETLSDEKEALQRTADDVLSRVDRIRDGAERYRAEGDALKLQLHEAQAEIATEREAMVSEADKLRSELAAERERALLLEARLNGLLEQYGVKGPGRDMSERELFLELEKEKEAFDRFYERNWGKAKKKIRRKVFFGKEKS